MISDQAKTDAAGSEKKFLIVLVALAVLFAALPYLMGSLGGGSATYLGYQYNTDDHMVYSAWMRQAMDGRFLMDNRFTTDVQPSLTINIYFFVLGLIAKVTGLGLASTLSRLFFSGLFIVLAYRLVKRLGWETSTTRLAMILTVVGGGLGFLVWHMFGVAIVRPSPLTDILNAKQPIDVWQPEAFVFPSMLTNGLFMVSLCLIVFAFLCILDAKEGWKPVLPGALSLCVLMNIHSYDVLIVALVMAGFLAATLIRKEVTTQWVIRAVAIGAGALPAALWFMHVIKVDPVFQARAGTDTPSASFRAVLFGYLPMMVLALTGLYLRPTNGNVAFRTRRLYGIGAAVILFTALFVAAGAQNSTYFLDASGWAVTLLIALIGTVALADENPVMNLLISWALVGTVAIYFPGLFQRKLAMGLSIPWAILAAYGIDAVLKKQSQSIKTMGTALACVLLGATSLRWLAREFQFIRSDTSRTSVQNVYLDADERKILDYLDSLKGRHVLIAPPGRPSPAFADGKQETGEAATAPLIPDLNTVASGLTGIYTFAGHWSETPDYPKRRSVLERVYFGKDLPPDQRFAALKQTGADYAIDLAPGIYKDSGLTPFIPPYGDVVVEGAHFRLIHLHLPQ